jgi:hypothetical protein
MRNTHFGDYFYIFELKHSKLVKKSRLDFQFQSELLNTD